jgi:hypothetical protein
MIPDFEGCSYHSNYISLDQSGQEQPRKEGIMDKAEMIKRMEAQHELTEQICAVMTKHLDSMDPFPPRNVMSDNLTLGDFKEMFRKKMAIALADVTMAHAIALVAFIRATMNIDTESEVRGFVERYSKDMITVFMQSLEATPNDDEE